MARYSPEHARQTRKTIVDAARRHLKRHGIDRSGVAPLMADASLTNGAFYKHFPTKDDLVATAVAADLDAAADWLAAQPTGHDAAERYIDDYLTGHHRDHPDSGDLSAALVAEIARRSAMIRRSYTQGFRSFVRVLARHLRSDDMAAADDLALELLAMLYGSMQLARAIDDPELSDRILERAKTAALARLHSVAPPHTA